MKIVNGNGVLSYSIILCLWLLIKSEDIVKFNNNQHCRLLLQKRLYKSTFDFRRVLKKIYVISIFAKSLNFLDERLDSKS